MYIYILFVFFLLYYIMQSTDDDEDIACVFWRVNVDDGECN